MRKNKLIPALLFLLLASLGTMAMLNRKQAPVSAEKKVNADPWQELQQLVQACSGREGIRFSGKMSIREAEKTRVLEEKSFDYSLFDNDYSWKLGSLELVGQEGMQLSIDHEARSIELYNGKGHPNGGFDMEALRKMLEAGSAALRVTAENGRRVLHAEQIKDPSVQAWHIAYDPASYLPIKIEMEMNSLAPLYERETEEESGGELKIYSYLLGFYYSKAAPLQVEKTAFRPAEKFIKTEGKRLSLQPAYSHYRLSTNAE